MVVHVESDFFKIRPNENMVIRVVVSLPVYSSGLITWAPCAVERGMRSGRGSEFSLSHSQTSRIRLRESTTTTTTVLWPFVWDYPREPVPEETFTDPPS